MSHSFDSSQSIYRTSLAFQIGSLVSCIASFLIILSAILFESPASLRRKVFMQLILLITISDFFGGLAVVIGFQRNNSPLCYFQSTFSTFFWTANWLWITCLTHQLYHMILYYKSYLSMRQLHLIVWSVSLVATLLPLTTNSFGTEDDAISSWCYLQGDKVTSFAWFIVVQVFVFVCCFVVMANVWVSLSRNLSVDLQHTKVILSALNAVRMYPISLIIVWAPNMVVLSLFYLQRTYFIVYILSSVIATQNGTILALIYFYRSQEGRARVYLIFKLLGITSLYLWYGLNPRLCFKCCTQCLLFCDRNLNSVYRRSSHPDTSDLESDTSTTTSSIITSSNITWNEYLQSELLAIRKTTSLVIENEVEHAICQESEGLITSGTSSNQPDARHIRSASSSLSTFTLELDK